MAKHLTFIGGSDIDYFYDVEAFLSAGDACVAKPADVKVGGCVVNAAACCAHLGSDVKHLDYLKENDEGSKLIVNALKKHGVDTSYIQYSNDAVNGNCLIMRKDAEKCIYVIDPVKPYFNEDEDLKRVLFNASFIYSLQAIYKQSFKDLSILKEAKRRGAQLIFDGGCQYKERYQVDMLLDLADGIFMNKIAFERFKEAVGYNPLEEMFNKSLKFICVTDGTNGTDLYTKDEVIHEEATRVEVIDSTGAGDCFAGSFLHFINEGIDYKTALHKASVHAAYACTKQGGLGGCLSLEELNYLLNQK